MIDMRGSLLHVIEQNSIFPANACRNRFIGNMTLQLNTFAFPKFQNCQLSIWYSKKECRRMSEKWKWKISTICQFKIQVSNRYVCVSLVSLVVTSIYVHIHSNGFLEYFSPFPISLPLVVVVVVGELPHRSLETDMIVIQFLFPSFFFFRAELRFCMKNFNASSFWFGFFLVYFLMTPTDLSFNIEIESMRLKFSFGSILLPHR